MVIICLVNKKVDKSQNLLQKCNNIGRGSQGASIKYVRIGGGRGSNQSDFSIFSIFSREGPLVTLTLYSSLEKTDLREIFSLWCAHRIPHCIWRPVSLSGLNIWKSVIFLLQFKPSPANLLGGFGVSHPSILRCSVDIESNKQAWQYQLYFSFHDIIPTLGVLRN